MFWSAQALFTAEQAAAGALYSVLEKDVYFSQAVFQTKTILFEGIMCLSIGVTIYSMWSIVFINAGQN